MTDRDRSPVEILAPSTWGAIMAERLAAAAVQDPRLVVCLPTGATPMPIYERLPAALDAAGGSLDDATMVLLDEYLGLPAGHEARCDVVLERALLGRLPTRPRTIVFDVDGDDPDAAARAYDDAISATGGLDLVLLGLGRNGHVGMNEPGSAPDAPTRVVALAPSTRAAAIGYGADPAPTHGLTLGMAGIRSAREIWLLATGAAKAGILGRTLDEPPTREVPASLLVGHPGLRVIVDGDAATGLRRR